MCLPFGTAPTVQQLIEHGQGSQRHDSEDEEQKDNEAGHVPAVVERVDLLDLHGDMGEWDRLRVPREIAWVYSRSDVCHDFWFEVTKTGRKAGC